MKPCPICKDPSRVHRSHSHGFWERNIFPLIRLKPLKCSRCRHRFYGFAFRAIPPAPKTSDIKQKKFSVFLEPADQEDFRQLLARLHEKERILASGAEENQKKEKIPVHEKWKVVGG